MNSTGLSTNARMQILTSPSAVQCAFLFQLCIYRIVTHQLTTGGGGSFGVVLESTIFNASPQVTLQAVVVSFSPNATLTERLWTILVDNGIQWANDGRGCLANSETAIYSTPTLSKDDAATSMALLMSQFGEELADTQVASAHLDYAL